MIKHTLTAAAMTVVLATPAFAQQPKAPDMSNPQKQMMNSTSHDSMSKSDKSMDKTMDKKEMNDQRASNDNGGFVHQQTASEWRSSKLVGTSVYGPNDKSIGDINDVLISSDGQVTAVVIGVGGFLGIGEKNVAVPLQDLNVQRKDGEINKITVSFTKDELKNAPKFAYYKGNQSTTTGMKATDDDTSSKMMPEKSDSKMKK